MNLPLFPYTGDDDYLDAFKQIVPPAIRAFAPDVLVTQLGIDSYHSDPLTHLQLTTGGYVEAVRELGAMGLPWLALGGGGYDLMAVSRAWTLAYGVMLGLEWPDRLPSGFALEHGVSLLRDSGKPEIPSSRSGRRAPPRRRDGGGDQGASFPAAGWEQRLTKAVGPSLRLCQSTDPGAIRDCELEVKSWHSSRHQTVANAKSCDPLPNPPPARGRGS